MSKINVNNWQTYQKAEIEALSILTAKMVQVFDDSASAFITLASAAQYINKQYLRL